MVSLTVKIVFLFQLSAWNLLDASTMQRTTPVLMSADNFRVFILSPFSQPGIILRGNNKGMLCNTDQFIILLGSLDLQAVFGCLKKNPYVRISSRRLRGSWRGSDFISIS